MLSCKLSVVYTAAAPLPHAQELHMDAMLIPRILAESGLVVENACLGT